MQFTILERIQAFDLLPVTGHTFHTMRTVRKLQEELTLSDEEKAAINFRVEGTQYRWDSDPLKDIAINDTAADLIRQGLKRLSDLEKLTMEYMGLCEKFPLEEPVPAE